MAGKPVHLEIPAENTSRAQEFYKNLFDWEFQAMEGPVEYHMTRISEDAGSAVIPSDTGAIRAGTRLPIAATGARNQSP